MDKSGCFQKFDPHLRGDVFKMIYKLGNPCMSPLKNVWLLQVPVEHKHFLWSHAGIKLMDPFARIPELA